MADDQEEQSAVKQLPLQIAEGISSCSEEEPGDQSAYDDEGGRRNHTDRDQIATDLFFTDGKEIRISEMSETYEKHRCATRSINGGDAARSRYRLRLSYRQIRIHLTKSWYGRDFERSKALA